MSKKYILALVPHKKNMCRPCPAGRKCEVNFVSHKKLQIHVKQNNYRPRFSRKQEKMWSEPRFAWKITNPCELKQLYIY